VGYCWGDNTFGALGIGTGTEPPLEVGPQQCGPEGNKRPCSPTPVAVSGGLTFAAMSPAAGGVHSCGVTAAGIAYCWGGPGYGELGDGTRTSSSVPVRVSGQP
jgi:alpha-tubulin suppressor-like RCC1 family protein